jgi:hypothetical protein
MAEEPKEPTSGTTSEGTKSAQQERPKLPPVDFTTFMSELATAAMAYLGGLQDPETKQTLVDLEMAKRMIDTIDLLKGKTKGNLTPPEENFLEHTLHNLKMTYIRVANNPPLQPTAEEAKTEG